MPTPDRPAYCPRCGYDLRGTPGTRCSECGHDVGRGQPSKLPWVGRRFRGVVPAYLQTLWIVLFQPRRLAQETAWPARLRDARRFYWISMLLATALGTSLIKLSLLRFGDPLLGLSTDMDLDFYLSPASALTDRWWGVIPLAVGIYAGLRACVALYRGIVRLGAGPNGRRFERRRLAVLSLYGAALALVEMPLAGALWYLWLWWNDAPVWGRLREWLMLASLAVGAVAVTIYCLASIGLLLRTGRWRALRVALALFLYPPLALLTWLTSVLAAQWVVGFVVVAVRSMTA